MARKKYCRVSSFGYCAAGDSELENCPYLQAIGEIARLSLENIKLEDGYDDGK